MSRMSPKASTLRRRQERRIRWQHGLSGPQAALVARFAFAGGPND